MLGGSLEAERTVHATSSKDTARTKHGNIGVAMSHPYTLTCTISNWQVVTERWNEGTTRRKMAKHFEAQQRRVQKETKDGIATLCTSMHSLVGGVAAALTSHCTNSLSNIWTSPCHEPRVSKK